MGGQENMQSREKMTVDETLDSWAGDDPVFVIKPTGGWRLLNYRELWRHRELFYFLVWRDLNVRYRQTLMGVAWSLLQPLAMMVIFTFVFSYLFRIPSEGLPYPLFFYSALLPWLYLSGAVSQGGGSLVANANLISKVYFPRLIIPLVSVTTPMVDFLLSFVTLICMMLWFGIKPTWGILVAPLFLILAYICALGINLWFSSFNVRYRDIGHLMPVVIQLWLYLSPIFYPVSLIPEKFRFLYSLNPMVGVIEGFRWALFGTHAPDIRALSISVLMIIVVLVGGVIYFRSTERTFADVI
jgi:lipopolysaccharide transport system permease protein